MTGIIAELGDIVGTSGVLLDEDAKARHNPLWGTSICAAQAIVRPSSGDELSRVMKLCYERGQTMVPHGGLTGLVQGTDCDASDIALSTERLRAIEHLDAESGTMVVQAGAILETVQNAARDAGWMFPVTLGARGSATIGGLIATNAGGNNVLRYGMMREQVLGMEFVLADGTLVSSMNEVIKNNTGYDLKHLIIGSEGTLGIVTRAVLRLRPLPSAQQTALVALDDFDRIPKLLKFMGRALEGKLCAFEAMWNNHYRIMTGSDRHQTFLPDHYPFYVLLEQEGANDKRATEHFLDTLEQAMEQALVADAVIAQSSEQREQLWHMREDVELIGHSLAPMCLFDVSLPIRSMNSYLTSLEEAIGTQIPGASVVTMGHLGDGNLHLFVGPTEEKALVDNIVYSELGKLAGTSVSAEHGIGLHKKAYLHHSRNSQELAMMRAIKQAFDPKNLLNPGKIL